MIFRISIIRNNPTCSFAAAELAKYLRMAGAECGITESDAFDPSDTGSLWLLDGLNAPRVEDQTLDDAFSIDIADGSGIIAGSNARSVLLGVYRYLRELGFAWVRPGADGEIIPKSVDRAVKLTEKPSYRHRGICIEGSVSLEHVLDIVDWAPKVGFNSYFLQFRDAYTFFERWYGPDFTRDEAVRCSRQVVEEITRRGLIYHAVGHGWTCEPLGIPGISWEPVNYDLPEDTTRYLAEIGGKRQMHEGIALNTNLCYSNPEVRRMMVEDVLRYLEEHPEVDILHFWLADGWNNQCECPECLKERPSDLYVRMLNELDRRMTERGFQQRIVFLLYVDLLWPPETERIENPSRFIRMFAPITRSYSQSYAVPNALPELPAYTRNRLQFPSNVDENIAFLRAWDKVFTGDGFDFDYHLWNAHYADLSGTWMPEIIHEDIRRLADLGLDGLMSCQVQRCFWPTGLSMYMMARALWDSSTFLEYILSDYYRLAFGPHWMACRGYMERLGRLFDWEYMVGKIPESTEAAARFAEARDLIARFLPIIKEHEQLPNKCHARSWHYLRTHAEVMSGLAEALELRARGQHEEARRCWESVHELIKRMEPDIHPALDILKYTEVLATYFPNLT